jgi:hypothetical protein
MGISKPFILKRTAKSGNNCGGAEDSNSILIETATVPNFTLSPNLCRTASGTTIVAMPTATPVVNGDWYEITTINPPVYNNTPITQLNLATLALGAHSYIFIPAAPNQNNNVCYDFVVWNVTLYNTVTPTFTLSTTYCETEAPFDLPTTSNNSIAGTWSLQYNGNTIPVTQWNPALTLLLQQPTARVATLAIVL